MVWQTTYLFFYEDLPGIFFLSCFFFFFFNVTILIVFMEFVTVVLLFYVLVFELQGLWDPRSLTRDRT